jgi:hypothetical protein
MHISLIFAGHLLARLGRPEVTNCINGLKQYSYAYEESGEQANEIHREFERARAGELELHHMAAVVARMNASSSSSSSSSSVREAPRGSRSPLVDGQQQMLLHRSNGVRDALSAHPPPFFLVS